MVLLMWKLENVLCTQLPTNALKTIEISLKLSFPNFCLNCWNILKLLRPFYYIYMYKNFCVFHFRGFNFAFFLWKYEDEDRGTCTKSKCRGGDRIFLADEHDCQSAVKNANYNID